jgi:hypothetical protein
MNIDEEPKSEQPQPENQESIEGDSVKKSWFKYFEKGEEEKWKSTEKDVKLRDDIESIEDKPIELKDGDKNDHIIKILNLFGRAYKLYATDFIPSGRPNGRISQKTMREYEYIGTQSPTWTQDSGPGFGPWAARLPYDKWQDKITKILEDKKWRKIFANIKFVSEAETSTETPMGGKGSGKTLFSFINDMLDNTEGSFKKHRKEIFKKYFGVDINVGDKKDGDNNEPRLNPTISKDDQGPTDTPYFSNATDTFKTRPSKLSELNNRAMKVTTENNVYTIVPYKSVKDDYVMFKYQMSGKSDPKQSIITDVLKADGSYKLEPLENKDENGIPYKSGIETYIGYASLKNNTFTVGNPFTFKSIPMNDAKNSRYTFKNYTFKISKIEYLVIPKNIKDKKGNQKQVIDLLSIDIAKSGKKDYIIATDKNDELVKQFKNDKSTK